MSETRRWPLILTGGARSRHYALFRLRGEILRFQLWAQTRSLILRAIFRPLKVARLRAENARLRKSISTRTRQFREPGFCFPRNLCVGSPPPQIFAALRDTFGSFYIGNLSVSANLCKLPQNCAGTCQTPGSLNFLSRTSPSINGTAPNLDETATFMRAVRESLDGRSLDGRLDVTTMSAAGRMSYDVQDDIS